MRLIKIGKYVNTHGIKGEIRIQSDFGKKDRVFVEGMILYINNKEFKIKSYRVHKDYDMVTFENINNINDIEYLKGRDIFINYETLNLSEKEIIIEDLIGFDTYVNKKIFSKVVSIESNHAQKLLHLENGKYIPYIDEFVENIDSKNRSIDLYEIGGITSED